MPSMYQRPLEGRQTAMSVVPSPSKSPTVAPVGGGGAATTLTVTSTLAVSVPSLAWTVTVYGEPATSPAVGESWRSPPTIDAKPGPAVIDTETGSPSGSPVVRSTVAVWPAVTVTGFGAAEIVGAWFGAATTLTVTSTLAVSGAVADLDGHGVRRSGDVARARCEAAGRRRPIDAKPGPAVIDAETGSPSGSPVVRSTVAVWPAVTVIGFGAAEIVGA